MTPATVNAYFNPPANEVGSLVTCMLLCLFTGALQIVFPAGILRPPFFNKDWPGYLKYGAFGQVASHELTVCPKFALLDGNMLTSFNVISMHSIQPDVCIIRKAS
jgi:hypothetical protein